MQVEQLIHDIPDLGGPVFRHEPRQALGQVMVLQDLLHEVAVEHGPRASVLGAVSLQVGCKFLRDNVRTGAGLTGDGHSASRRTIFARCLPRASRLQVAVDEA